MIKRIHCSHLGVEGCLRLARKALYWPNMNTAVRDFVSTCDICNSFQPKQQQEPLLPQKIPDRPWSQVGVDLFELQGTHYVIAVDYYSNFFEVDKLQDTCSTTVIHKLKGYFARHGIPDELRSDNGPQFTSKEFARFVHESQFKHTTSSSHYPQSNGKVENSVKLCKALMKKAIRAKSDIYLALLDFRNTPTEKIHSSPAQRLFGRRTKTQLSMSKKLLIPETVPPGEVKGNLHKSKESQAKFFHQRQNNYHLLSQETQSK
ncbi:uncharacterized protein K02A2.6-like [Corticium candelabrum]|uniref:uncharacterized protein K02A2.6-like n=1 Tax=Corticium candelabrum TaxID=121492 RepID=UPI002E2766B8|nr:uncharacterized protein K02A2.6-like [Corticium candelabrum]